MINDLSKKYYKISDVAEFVGVPATTLRYWEKEFPAEIKPTRTVSRIRYYTPEDVETLHLIKFLLYDRGMKIEAAKRELKQNRKNISKRLKILNELQNIKSDLQGLLTALEKRR